MTDLAELILRPFAVALLWVLRAALWLGWELMFSIIGWSAGWCVCRTLTLGKFPAVGLRDGEHYEFLPRLLVELIGLGSIGLACWWLAGILEQ